MKTTIAVTGAALMLATILISSTAHAHRSGCHRWHSCPSDHGTYTCGDLGYTSECPKRPAPEKAAPAADLIPGPINARIVSVYDGDTLTVDAKPWPGLTARTSVRVDGVDTPEIRGECQEEKDLALRARDFVRATVGAEVRLTNIRLGKYAGRVVADVWVNEQKLSDLLIAESLGRPYHGGHREGWCP